jgi:hypothetical protein
MSAMPTSSSRPRRLARALSACWVVASVVLGLIAAPQAATAGDTVTGSALKLLRRLATAPERPGGYDVDKFPHWRNADGDGCDTRAEVLIVESLRPVSVGAGCRLSGGRWRSAYDGVTTRDASTFDIDHVVALKEAWSSGAKRWSTARRQAFANDLGDPRTLRAVTAGANRSKGDRDPSEWMPPRSGIHCRYLGWWVAVKVRWRLAVNAPERTFIRDRLQDCPARPLRVTIA